MSQLGATAEVGFVGSCLGRRFVFSPFPESYSAGLEAKVREVGSLKPWTANVKVLKTNGDVKGFTLKFFFIWVRTASCLSFVQ